MHWRRGKKLTRWSEFTDHQLQNGSECAKAGPDKLEPRVLIRVGAKTWEKKNSFFLHSSYVKAAGAVCV